LDCELHEQNTLDSTIQWAKAMIEGFDIQGTDDRFQGLAPHQVVVGLLADHGNYSTHKQGFQTLRQEYPAIKGMMLWSINADNDQGYPFMNTFYDPVINDVF
jgi:chitinase